LTVTALLNLDIILICHIWQNLVKMDAVIDRI